MVILKFQPCAICIHGIKDCCQCATITNSQVPQLALRSGNAKGPNTKCRIFLRQSKEPTLSGSQKRIIQRLFEANEIATAISQAITEYANEWKEHHEGFAASIQEVQSGGILPYFVLCDIVID
jgi:hypothetical protein